MALAGTFTFNGVFTQDDQRASFAVILNSPQQVTLLTTQYANGGFAPVLSIFEAGPFGPGDPSLLATNSGGAPCGVRALNPATGLCLDALLGFDPVLGTDPLGTLAAGTYLVVLTEQDNVPNGPDLASGFSRDGQGNFTAVPGVNNGPFVDPSNPNITDGPGFGLTVQNVSNAVAAPEPGTLWSCLGCLGVLALRRYGSRKQ